MSNLGTNLNKAESSRINGAKSRGPITPQGKQRSSLNAIRHGLLAKSVCLTNENPEGVKQILQDFLTRFQPADDVELRIVEQLASCAMRLGRFASTETALFDMEMDKQQVEVKNRFEKIDHACIFAMAFKSLADNSKSLQLYLRYEAAITRQYDRALKQLLLLRTKFPIPADHEPPTTNHEPSPSEIPNEPEPPEKCCGFNIQGICGLRRECPDANLYQKLA